MNIFYSIFLLGFTSILSHGQSAVSNSTNYIEFHFTADYNNTPVEIYLFNLKIESDTLTTNWVEELASIKIYPIRCFSFVVKIEDYSFNLTPQKERCKVIWRDKEVKIHWYDEVIYYE